MTNCGKCGEQVSEESRFCSHCGESLDEDANQSRLNRRKNLWAVLLPLIALLISSGALLFTYNYEKEINQEVLADKEKAVKLALDGKYMESEAILAEAVDKRPDFNAVRTELSSIRSALAMDSDLDKIDDYIDDNRLKDAKESLGTIQNQIINHNSKLSATLSPRTNELDSRITVKEISHEINQLDTIDNLAVKLDTLSGLNLEEAAKVREKISQKIVSLAVDKAEKAMDNKQYTDAVNVVDRGLQYVSNHEKLVKLKKRVIKEQTAFEQAEEERIKHAMQQAAKEDLKNKNDAVKILDVKLSNSEFGEIKVSGKVQSVATKIISSIKVKYDLVNNKDKVVKSSSSQIYPMYLNPGDKGNFEKVIYDVKGDLTVKVTDLEWYVE